MGFPPSGFRSKGSKNSERLARFFAAQIMDGSLEEGSKLAPESEMLNAVGVSRGTLREALRLLEVWGLIEIRQGLGGGPIVRKPLPEEFTDHVALALQCRRLSLSDVADARLALEPMVASMAATRILDEDLATLRALIKEMTDATDNTATFIRCSSEFHDGIAAASDSVVLRMLLTALREISDASLKNVEHSSSHLLDAVRSHQRILECLATGDADAAEAAMEEELRAVSSLLTDTHDNLAEAPVEWSHRATDLDQLRQTSQGQSPGGARRHKSAERLARYIVRSVAAGEYGYGDRLPPENQLMERVSVSRGTLREAIRLLESWGLIEIRTGPHGGAVIKEPSDEDSALNLAMMLQFQGLKVQPVVEARIALEPMVVKLAAQRVAAGEGYDPGKLQEINQLVVAMSHMVHDRHRFWAASAEFYALLSAIAQSPVVGLYASVLRVISGGILRQVFYTESELQRVAVTYQRVVDKIASSDAGGATRIMRRHLTLGHEKSLDRYPTLDSSLIGRDETFVSHTP